MGYYTNKLYNGQVLMQYMNIDRAIIEEEASDSPNNKSTGVRIYAHYWLTEADRREGLKPMHTESYYIQGELFERYYGGVGSFAFEHWKEPHYYALDEIPEFKDAEPAL